jgi:LysR family transcriptional activator of dmlA
MKNLSDLAFFVELCKYPSLAAAALSLDVTAPAVSRRLASLEVRLGVRLLNRSTRKLSLTAEGEKYLGDGALILQDIEQLENELVQGREQPRGYLKVNASLGFGRIHIGDVVEKYTSLYPDVEVLLHLTVHPLDLVAEGFDLGIRFGSPPDSRLVAKLIATNRRVLCASPDYLKTAGVLDTPKDLLKHDCLVIHQELNASSNWHLLNGKNEVSIKVRGPLSTNHGEVAVAWALAGKGIMLRSEWDILDYLVEGRLMRVLPDWVGAPANIYAVYNHRHSLSAKVRVFIDLLSDRFCVDTPHV